MKKKYKIVYEQHNKKDRPTTIPYPKGFFKRTKYLKDTSKSNIRKRVIKDETCSLWDLKIISIEEE